jgi:hypothetical protein
MVINRMSRSAKLKAHVKAAAKSLSLVVRDDGGSGDAECLLHVLSAQLATPVDTIRERVSDHILANLNKYQEFTDPKTDTGKKGRYSLYQSYLNHYIDHMVKSFTRKVCL